PVASATDPAASGGFYTFTGTLPERSGKQVLYAVWQRSDSPEAFYSCSDVTFGGGSQAGGGESGGDGTGGGEEGGGESSGSGGSSDEAADPAPTASAPSDEQIEDGAGKSTVENHGHGDDDHRTSAAPVAAA